MSLFQCRFRDFPQAIFTSQSLEVKGTLLGAEQKPANRCMFIPVHIKEQRSRTGIVFRRTTMLSKHLRLTMLPLGEEGSEKRVNFVKCHRDVWPASQFTGTIFIKAEYALIDQVRSGWTGKPLAPCAVTESHIFPRPARPTSVNKYFIVPPLLHLNLLENF